MRNAFPVRARRLLTGLLALGVGAAFAPVGCGSSDETDAAGATGGAGCPAPQSDCGGVCVDTTNNAAHCGTCGLACAADESCAGGVCARCPPGTDTQSDPSNCGFCGVRCEEFQVCVGGSCQCPDGQAACTSGCSDIKTDKLNCGQCNIPCAAAQSCVGGVCVCPEGQELCFNQCVDTMGDANFCGNCNTACGSGAHCIDGECESVSGCGDVKVDKYEGNETCAAAKELPEATEGGATAVTVSDPTLHHTDESLDTDWYSVFATEGSHVCLPFSSQCYFVLDIAFTPPDAAAHATYQLCVVPEECSGTPICTDAGDWNAGKGKYELAISWEGSCGFSDDKQLYVKVARNGGVESCAQYRLEYEMTYTDEACE